jgi:hypothetical protein
MNPADKSAPAADGPEPHELLLKELDERNQNTRTAMQAFIAWYSFFITTNLGVIGLAFTNAEKAAAVRPYLSGLFIFINVLAISATFAVAWASAAQGDRINEIIRDLNFSARRPPPETPGAPRAEMSSPYPASLILILLAVVALSLACTTYFWCAFLFWGMPGAAAG